MNGWIASAISSAISLFLKGVVTAALNPLLDLLSNTLLTTPSPAAVPRLGELWTNSWQITLACYAILICIGGVLVMGHETVQTRYSIKEIGPRIITGFLAAALSLVLAGKAISLANALSKAAMGDGVDANAAGDALSEMVQNSVSSTDDVFMVLIGGVFAGVLLALLITYVVRVALTMTLIAGAPLALMCHALPQTEGIARWWWKAFGGVLAIQIAQSITLITGLRIFLTPYGVAVFGSSQDGLVNLIVALALMYILFKIPFWVLKATRISNGRSFVGSMVRAYIAAKTFGLLRGNPGKATSGATRHPSANSPKPLASRRHRASGNNALPPGRTTVPKRRPPGAPLFLQPITTAPEQTPRRASGPPPMPEFRAPGDPTNPQPAQPRPARPPGAPVFRAPGKPSNPRPTRRPGRLTPVNTAFREPNTRPPIRPVQATTPPKPATFRPPVPETNNTPRRPPNSPPSPATFSSPPPQPRPTRTRPQGGDRR